MGPNKASKRKFARIRARSMYRRLLKADEKNWKITAPIVPGDGALKKGDRRWTVMMSEAVDIRTMAEHELIREMNLPWKRED